MALTPSPVGSRRSTLWVWVIVLGGTIPLLAVLGVGLGRDPRAIPSPLVGKPAPAFTLRSFDGTLLKTTDYRGRVVIVNFWASWCYPACYEEAPELQRAWERYRARNVVILGVNIQDRESAARQFIRQLGLTFPSGSDPTGAISISYGVYGVPETFILDRQGRIVYKHVGAITEQVIADKVDPLLH